MDDIRAKSEYLDSEKTNLELLIEYGGPAWAEDISHARDVLNRIEEAIAREMSVLEKLDSEKKIRDDRYEKEVTILSHDLFNYIRNNEKTLLEVKSLESKAKRMYQVLKAQDQSNPQLDRLAQQLLT
jgi:hypothetical protein